MRLSSRILILLSAIAPLALAGSLPAAAQDALAGRYIVVMKETAPVGAEDAVALAYGANLSHRYGSALRGFAASIPAERIDALRRDARVQMVSEDREVSILSNASVSAKGASTVQPPQSLPTGIDRMNAEWKANKGAGVNVAILDTGIDLSHPDLKANIVGGKNCSTGRSYADGNGHGTHVAGTVAALDNGVGVVGVAPEAKLWSVRVLDNSGSGSWSSIICGLDFVTAKAPANGGPISVVNMSLGGSGSSDGDCGNSNNDALHRAVCRARDAGVTVVVAAGNDGRDSALSVPAAYDDAVITVSALADSDGASGGLGAATSYGADDTFAGFSNYGAAVDLAAPGVAIRSTWKGGAYNTISGTSMATPHVAGAAALYLATHPGETWSNVRDALRALGEPAGSGHTDPSGLHPEPVVRADTL